MTSTRHYKCDCCEATIQSTPNNDNMRGWVNLSVRSLDSSGGPELDCCPACLGKMCAAVGLLGIDGSSMVKRQLQPVEGS